MPKNGPATVTLASHGLELRYRPADIRKDRPFNDTDLAQLQTWAKQYRQLAGQKSAAIDLLQLGQQLFDWLNGADKFLTRILENIQPPLLMEFRIAKQDDSPKARAFLDTPWELLASDGRHWALRDDIIFNPIRRIGKVVTHSLLWDCSPF